MTTPEQSEGDRSRDELLAGEYVLGVLSLADRERVAARIARDRAFAAIVARWQDNLASFNDDYDEVRPPPGVYSKIETAGTRRDRQMVELAPVVARRRSRVTGCADHLRVA
jgi:anti-sigma-K factor RskA